MLKKLFITVLILNSIACFVSAKTRAGNPKEDVNLMANNFDYDTKKFVLDNGMTVILRNVPTIECQLTNNIHKKKFPHQGNKRFF